MPQKRRAFTIAFGDAAFGLQATQSPWQDLLMYNAGREHLQSGLTVGGEAVVGLLSAP